jgi:hypothetical protein
MAANRVRYRRNRLPRKFRFGPKVQDEISGAWTYEYRLVQDYDGYLVDPRKGTLDRPFDGDGRSQP